MVQRHGAVVVLEGTAATAGQVSREDGTGDHHGIECGARDARAELGCVQKKGTPIDGCVAGPVGHPAADATCLVSQEPAADERRSAILYVLDPASR